MEDFELLEMKLRLEVVVNHSGFSSRSDGIKPVFCGWRQKKQKDNEDLNEIWTVAIRMKR